MDINKNVSSPSFALINNSSSHSSSLSIVENNYKQDTIPTETHPSSTTYANQDSSNNRLVENTQCPPLNTSSSSSRATTFTTASGSQYTLDEDQDRLELFYTVGMYEDDIEDISVYRDRRLLPVHLGDLYHGRYRIRLKVGHGSYSIVWLAVDEDNGGQHVILKFLQKNSILNSQLTNMCEARYHKLEETVWWIYWTHLRLRATGVRTPSW